MANDFSKLFSGFLGSAFSGEKQGEIVTRDIFSGGEDYVYQAYLPPQINKDAKLPLVVFLHGIRERGSGGYISGMFGTVIKQYLKAIPAIVLLPQCRPNVYWTDAKMDTMVIAQTEAIENEFSIDERRKYLMGVSMGGYGVWHFASEYPQRFCRARFDLRRKSFDERRIVLRRLPKRSAKLRRGCFTARTIISCRSANRAI